MANFDLSSYELENVTTGMRTAFRNGAEGSIIGCIQAQTHETGTGKIYSQLEGVTNYPDPFFDMFITPALYAGLGSPPPPMYKAGDTIYEFFKSKYPSIIQAKITSGKLVLVFKTTGSMYEDEPTRGYYKLVPKAAAAAAAEPAIMISDAATTSSAAPPPRRSTRTPKGGKRRQKKSRKSRKSSKYRKSRKYMKSMKSIKSMK